MSLFGSKDKGKSASKKGMDDTKSGEKATHEYQMSRINLLPWREELRKEREMRFYAMLGIAVAVTLLCFGGVHLYFQEKINYQKERNAYLNARIKEAEKQIKEIEALEKEKQRLFARMEEIKKLQASRPNVVHLFDELVATLPEGVYYTSFTQKGTKLDIKGLAQSDARVSTLMRSLDSSEWFKNPTLKFTVLKKKGKRQVKEFALTVTQTQPKKPKEGEDGEEEEGEG